MSEHDTMCRDISRSRRWSERALVTVMVLAIGLPVLPYAVAEDPPSGQSRSTAKVRNLVIVEPRLTRRCRALDMTDRPADLAELENRVSAWLATCVTSRTGDVRRERALVEGNPSLARIWAALPGAVQRIRIVPRYTWSGERISKVVFSSPEVSAGTTATARVGTDSDAGQDGSTTPSASVSVSAPAGQMPVTERPPPDDRPVDKRSVDPMLPDDAQDLLFDARELIGRLRQRGEIDDADTLEQLVDGAAKLLVSVGLLVGVYYVGTKFRAGKLLFMWGTQATGPAFQRALGRLERLLPEVESALDQVVDAARPHVPGAGSGLDWRVLDQVIDPTIPAQLDSAACGPACARMLLAGRGLDIAQSELVERARAKLHPQLKSRFITARTMLGLMKEVDPEGIWVGGELRDDFLSGKDWRQLLEIFGAKGSWLAQVGKHFVVVDRFDSRTNELFIRDPWYEPAQERGIVAGTHYRVSAKTFFEHWIAVSIFRK